MSKEKSKPGRIVMLESVPRFRGCVSLKKDSVQRLDKEATKELLKSGKAEAFEDYTARKKAEAKAEAARPVVKPKRKEDPKGPTPPSKPSKPKEDPKGPTAPDPKRGSKK